MPHSRATCVIGRDSVSRIASRRNSSLYAFGPRFFMPHLLPRISIEALEVSTKSGELQVPHSTAAGSPGRSSSSVVEVTGVFVAVYVTGKSVVELWYLLAGINKCNRPIVVSLKPKYSAWRVRVFRLTVSCQIVP